MYAQSTGTRFWSRPLRWPLARPKDTGQLLRPDELWDLHGTTLFALACTLLGDEPAALRAVTWAMVDLYSRSDELSDVPRGEALRAAAGAVYLRCQDVLTDPTMRRTMTLPPLMALLGEIAQGQRGALALCGFGGHSYRQAATLLELPPEMVAHLLTSGLQELGRLAAAER